MDDGKRITMSLKEQKSEPLIWFALIDTFVQVFQKYYYYFIYFP
jgi:hypothetical protein